MLDHQLPHWISHLTAAGRHALMYCHAAGRAALGAFYQVESPRDAFRVTLRQTRRSRQGEPRAKVQAPGRATPLLIHFHIFKNAGTSFEWALQKAFGDQFRLYDSPTPGGIISPRGLARLARREARLSAISSHQAVPPAPRIMGRKVLTSILIRDPVARIGSIYSFERTQQANTPGAIKAKELDFKRYVEWRLKSSPTTFCNYQVHFCSGRKHKYTDCDRSDLEAAIIRLDAIDIVGTVRRYAEWLALAQSILGEYFGALSFVPAHQNRSVSKATDTEPDVLARLVDELGSRLTEELLHRNELDMCLHQVADALLTRRLAERSVVIDLLNAYNRVNTAGETRAIPPPLTGIEVSPLPDE